MKSTGSISNGKHPGTGFSRLLALPLLAALCLAAVPAAADGPALSVELEAGPLFQSRNDVQIPNDGTGTRFSLVDVAGNGPWFAARAYLTLTVGGRHQVRLLAAPLAVREEAVLEEPVEFAGGSFAAGPPATATYRFNSWRATYRYRMRDGGRFDWWLGFTAKIRDAKIQLDQEGASAKKTDVGFVPLLHLAARYRLADRWRLMLDLDGLAGGPGRAFDASARVSVDLGGSAALAAGYRTVEGGADVDEVYNFAWLHYLVVSLELRY